MVKRNRTLLVDGYQPTRLSGERGYQATGSSGKPKPMPKLPKTTSAVQKPKAS